MILIKANEDATVHPTPVTRLPFLGPVQLENSSLGLGLDWSFVMKASKFSEAQTAFVLRQAEEGRQSASVAQSRDQRGDVCRTGSRSMRV